jgi:uncharacterized protein involved in exopolysaccharide biosynthesis
MRFAFWRKNSGARQVAAILPQAAPSIVPPTAHVRSPVSGISEFGDVDLREIWQVMTRKSGWIIIPTLLAFGVSLAVVNVITPRYKSEARIFIDGRDNVFLRPNGEKSEERTALDAEAVTSQVQLLLSRDLAREVIQKNQLAQLPEFDPARSRLAQVRSILALVGIGRDPLSMTQEERVLDAYFDRLTAYAVDKSRVMVIEFQSRDPELAAKIANSIADGYLILQQQARQTQAKAAGQWLSGEIDSLRTKVADAEARAEAFRSKSSLFIGTNNTSLSNQQLGELNTQLNNARAAKSDAETKSKLIRELLQTGQPIESADVLNSELSRRLSEQRITLRAQLAEQSSTLLDGHPRIKELKAQLADLDRQIREEAAKISRSLDNDARIAGARVDGLSANLEQLKRQASSSNSQDVELRALEREAKSQRDLLESYLAKYREATARENIDAAPADGRIISRAIVSNTPAYPRKLPIVLIATMVTLILTSGYIATGELLRMTAPNAMPARRSPANSPSFGFQRAHPQMSAAVNEIDRLADQLHNAGAAARKITVISTRLDQSSALTALTLARLLARRAKVVVVDLAMNSPTLMSIAVDPATPGLSDMMQGTASFGQIITKDRFSSVQIVGAGRSGNTAYLQSPRIALAIDALQRAYDHVILDAGTGSNLPSSLIATHAHAVLVADAAFDEPAARATMRDNLMTSGFTAVTILKSTVETAGGTPADFVAA